MMHDDLLRPVNRMSVKFSGKTPERFYKEIYNLILVTFRVPEHSIQEKEFEWTTGEKQKFKIKWTVNKDLDKFSYYWIEIGLSGQTSGGTGTATVSIDGALRTEYPQDTFWQRSLIYEFIRMFWHSTFYGAKRDEYLKDGRRMLSQFIDNLKHLSRV
jgi:hypothetical protein